MDTIRTTNRRKEAGGFTFFEIAVTLAVLVIGVSGFLSIFSTSLRTARNVKHDLTGPEAARTAAAYVVAKGIRPPDANSDERFDIPEAINGYYVSVTSGRLDQFELNVGDEAGVAPPTPTLEFEGTCNLNPNNSDDMEFQMLLADSMVGTHFTHPDFEDPIDEDSTFIARADLHHPDGRNMYGCGQKVWEVTYIRFRPKGNANKNTFLYEGQELDVANDKVYTFYAPANNPMKLTLYNSHYDRGGRAMGRWWIGSLSGSDVSLEENMDGGGDHAGDLLTLKVDVYESDRDRNDQARALGTFFIRAWYRK